VILQSYRWRRHVLLFGGATSGAGADTVVPPPTFTSTTGWRGSNSPADPSCLVFDGVDDYVDWGEQSSLFNLGTGARAFGFWVVFSTVAATQWLFHKHTGSVGQAVYLDSSGKLNATLNGAAGTRSAPSASALSANTLYRISARYSGSGGSWSFYVNGVAFASTAGGAAAAINADNSARAESGRKYDGTCYFSGRLTEFVAYPRVPDASEEAALYDAGPYIYQRATARGTVQLEGMVETMKGTLVPCHHITPIDWWIRNEDVGSGECFMVTEAAQNAAAGTNNLTIGADPMREQLAVSRAQVLQQAATQTPTSDEDEDPYWRWRLPYTPQPVPSAAVTPTAPHGGHPTGHRRW